MTPWVLFFGLLSLDLQHAAAADQAPHFLECAQKLTSQQRSPSFIARALFGLDSPLWSTSDESPTRSPLMQLDALAQRISTAPRLSFHAKSLVSLYSALRQYPQAILNDRASENGLDLGLWDILETESKLNTGFATQSQRDRLLKQPLSDVQQQKLVRKTQIIRTLLGFLNLSERDAAPLIRGRMPALKARVILALVTGRFGGLPWGRAGAFALRAIPEAERRSVLALLDESKETVKNWKPMLHIQSGEWGMLDTLNGKLWFGTTAGPMTWNQAIAYCKLRGQDLPGNTEWNYAGFRQIMNVFPDLSTIDHSSSPRLFTNEVSTYAYELRLVDVLTFSPVNGASRAQVDPKTYKGLVKCVVDIDRELD